LSIDTSHVKLVNDIQTLGTFASSTPPASFLLFPVTFFALTASLSSASLFRLGSRWPIASIAFFPWSSLFLHDGRFRCAALVSLSRLTRASRLDRWAA
jgi:hypothetical protein